MFKQLELDFASALASALDEPEQADISLMCASLDQHLQGRSPHEQLRVAGDAIKDMAEVCLQRAELMIQGWEERYNSEGPVLDEDFLAGMVQQTMFLDVSDLCRQPKSRKRRQGFMGKPVESVVGDVSKESVLKFVEELESGESVAMKVSHEEDVSAWVAAISTYLQQVPGKVPMVELMQELQLSLVSIWLGMLLGGFQFEQRGGFYDQNVWIETGA
ncbi:hypothetical protein [Acaryochloris marina]|uniref:Uncharacterized protein n=1 Tax=Acaryochloris marina (strain MBIC 11017) TaxID=329726 RepID=A8ZL76_ACAM1|nr:hypothetical protein [Acaryochloris marina]ABW31903.1 hypothetical protein AM1_B0183 [Acaryochloris marina MBIC11017]BDM82934.1 hypothetical protein AM10699_57950 [Acaryochloris marina MBIC10699]